MINILATKLLKFKYRYEDTWFFEWGQVTCTNWDGVWVLYCPGSKEDPEEHNPHLCVYLGKFHINVDIPIDHYCHIEDGTTPPWYGVILRPFASATDYLCSRQIIWYWGDKSYCFDMPWNWRYVRHDILSSKYTYPFEYITVNGSLQITMATIQIEECEWRWAWLQWCRFPRLVLRYIEIEFDDPIGERADSHKGGVVGCSYELLDGETGYDCLKRMSREREL